MVMRSAPHHGTQEKYLPRHRYGVAHVTLCIIVTSAARSEKQKRNEKQSSTMGIHRLLCKKITACLTRKRAHIIAEGHSCLEHPVTSGSL